MLTYWIFLDNFLNKLVSISLMKIISLSPVTTEILFALGLDEEIIGVTRHCDFPNKARSKPKFGMYPEIDIDDIKKQMPSHVFVFGHEQEKYVEKLSKFTKTYHYNPTTLEEVYDGMNEIAEFVGIDNSDLVARMQEDIAAIALKLPKIKLTVYVEEWHKPPTAAGLWVGDIISFTGATPFIESGKKSKKTTLKQIETFSPNHIIIAWHFLGSNVTLSEIQDREDWEKILGGAKVDVIDDAFLNRPGPRLVEGFKELVRIIHKKKDGFDTAMGILDEYYNDTPPIDMTKEFICDCVGDQPETKGVKKWNPPKINMK